jgi:hypothetical protein
MRVPSGHPSTHVLCNVFALALAASSTTLAAAPSIVAAMGEDGGSVQVMDAAGSAIVFEPYGQAFSGGVFVAAGDVNGDGVPDIITGSGPGIVATVRVFDGSTVLPVGTALEPFGSGFLGGVHVAAGDVNGDGRADVITGSGPGSGATVRIYDGRTLAPLRSFTAFDGFAGGVRVASGDVNGDGREDIIVAAASTTSGGPHVKVFDGASGVVLRQFDAFQTTYGGGVYVAAGDVNGDQTADFVVASGEDPKASGGGPHVKVFSGRDLALLADFRPYASGFRGGVRVAAGDVNGDGLADIITAPGVGGAAQLTRWLAPQATQNGQVPVFNVNYNGGVFVAASAQPPTLFRDSFE